MHPGHAQNALYHLLAHDARDARRRARVIWPEGRLLLRSRPLEEEL